MIHVGKIEGTKSLLRDSGKILKRRKIINIIGPLKVGNKHKSQSNYIFDNSLKMKNDHLDPRNIEEVSQEIKKVFLREH